MRRARYCDTIAWLTERENDGLVRVGGPACREACDICTPLLRGKRLGPTQRPPRELYLIEAAIKRRVTVDNGSEPSVDSAGALLVARNSKGGAWFLKIREVGV